MQRGSFSSLTENNQKGPTRSRSLSPSVSRPSTQNLNESTPEQTEQRTVLEAIQLGLGHRESLFGGTNVQFWHFTMISLFCAKQSLLLPSREGLVSPWQSGLFNGTCSCPHHMLSQQIGICTVPTNTYCDPTYQLRCLPGAPSPHLDILPQSICLSGMLRRGWTCSWRKNRRGLFQTPRPLVRIQVYLRTCFLTQALSQPRQTQVMLIPCFLGGCDFM